MWSVLVYVRHPLPSPYSFLRMRHKVAAFPPPPSLYLVVPFISVAAVLGGCFSFWTPCEDLCGCLTCFLGLLCTSLGFASFGRSCSCLSCFPGLHFSCTSFGRSWSGDCTPPFWGEGMFFFPFTTVHSSSGTFSDDAAVTTAATAVDDVAVFVIVVVVGQGGGCKFLRGHALDMCPDHSARPTVWRASIHHHQHLPVPA